MRRRLIAVLAATCVLSCGRREARIPSYENAPVIIISIDTVRSDRLPAYGYKGVETPALDSLRRDGILFLSAWSHVPLTLPSHLSMLTGLLPPDHKVRNNIGYLFDASVPTLPAVLKPRGYESGAAVSAYVLRGSTGIGSSFDYYEDSVSVRGTDAIGTLSRSGRKTSEIALRWIEARSEKPFFFLFHIFEPHSPYEPEEPFRSRYSDAYDAEIATADDIVGSFVERLKKAGVYDKAVVIVVSDHGEGLDDHGEPEHGIFVYREAIQVPLIVKLPRSARAGEALENPVGLVDIFPTIAELVGAQKPAGTTARSLLGPTDPQRRIYAESVYGRVHLGWSELRSLVDARYQFIQAPKPELYDHKRDPAEKANLLSSERRTYASMRDELQRYGTALDAPGAIDPEEAKKLAALGYLSSTSSAAAGPLPDPKDRIGEIVEMVRASELLRARRYGEAITLFRVIVERNPRLSDAWNQLGTALEESGRNEEASDVYRRAIGVAPELAPEFALRRRAVLLRLERYDEAERHARLAKKMNSPAMHLLLARIALARKDFRRAEQEATAASTDAGTRIAAEVLLAQAYAKQGKLPEASAVVQRLQGQTAAEGTGPVESLEFVRGDILARMERYDEAEKAFRREIELFPKNLQTYANLYLLYMVTNRPAEAQAALEAMVRASPTGAAYLFAARTVDALGDARGAGAWRKRAERASVP